MASRRLHQLVVAASCAVLLLAASAAVHGDGRVVMVPPASGKGGSAGETPDQWASWHLFLVGDVLDFKNWNGTVLIVLHSDFKRCRSASPLLRFADGNTTRVTLYGYGGLFYFIGGAPARCEAGQRMAVRVAPLHSPTIGAPAAALAPAYVEQAAPDQSVPSPRPWKKVSYAVLGFLAGCVFCFCCVFFFARCCGPRE